MKLYTAMPAPPLGVLFSGCLCVCPESLWTRYFPNHLGEFHHTHNFGALGDKDETIIFLGQKIKCEGHDQTKYGKNAGAYASIICCRVLFS